MIQIRVILVESAASTLIYIYLVVSNICFKTNIYVLWLKVKVALSYPALCDPMDYIVYGILQARILEWVAFSFSRGSSQFRD